MNATQTHTDSTDSPRDWTEIRTVSGIQWAWHIAGAMGWHDVASGAPVISNRMAGTWEGMTAEQARTWAGDAMDDFADADTVTRPFGNTSRTDTTAGVVTRTQRGTFTVTTWPVNQDFMEGVI